MVDHPYEREAPFGMADQWLTYPQAGELLGMSAEAARQRARRLRWRTQRGNDGRTLILLPDDIEIRPRPRPAGQPTVQTAGQTGEDNALASLLREQLERERDRADRGERRAEVAEWGLEAARAQADAERNRAEAAQVLAARAEGEAKALQERVQAAESARDAVRTELVDWTAGGPLARAWRALWYRRG